MNKNSAPLLKVLRKEKVDHMPIWLMRQAGRYLPEYRAIRAQNKSFIDFCLSPKPAADVTLQPVRRFDMDAAILFADILLLPYAMGQKIEFHEGLGPLLEPIETVKQSGQLLWQADRLDNIYETIELVKEELDETKALLGFSGGLWTVACYMIDGSSKNGFAGAARAAQQDQALLDSLIDHLFDATLEYLGRQIEAGVDAVQIFDSHAGLLKGQLFNKYIIEPTTKLVQAIKAEYPHTPIIGFPRGASPEDVRSYAEKTGIDCLGLDQQTDIHFAKRELMPLVPLQGNLDPQLLLKGGQPMKDGARAIFDCFGPNHIFNLGHGVIKETPPEHVQELVSYVKSL